MKTIDIHAHVVPESLWKAIDAKQEWHGFRRCDESFFNSLLAAAAGRGRAIRPVSCTGLPVGCFIHNITLSLRRRGLLNQQ